MDNKFIEQEKRWMNMFIELKVELDSITEGLNKQVEGFTHKRIDDEKIRCFSCDKCKEELKHSDKFVKIEVWENMGLYRTEIIGSRLNVYHPKCWNALISNSASQSSQSEESLISVKRESADSKNSPHYSLIKEEANFS